LFLSSGINYFRFTSIPLALILSPLVGLFAKNYPKIYRDRSLYLKMKKKYEIIFFLIRRESKARREDEVPMDLYNLLSVSRTATDKEIKN
jgi:hypothetical protein